MIESALLDESHEGIKQDDGLALEYVAKAWLEAQANGVESQDVATAAIFAALATLVNKFGEETVAELTKSLGPRIINGEFTAAQALQ